MMDEETEMVYMFQLRLEGYPRTDANTLLGADQRARVAGLSGPRKPPITVESQALRLSRALIGGSDEKPPDKAVALMWKQQLIGITESTARRWEADLRAPQPGIYAVANPSEVIPINDPD